MAPLALAAAAAAAGSIAACPPLLTVAAVTGRGGCPAHGHRHSIDPVVIFIRTAHLRTSMRQETEVTATFFNAEIKLRTCLRGFV